MHKRIRAAAALCLLAGGGVVLSADAPPTLRELLEIVRVKNQSLAAGRAQVEATRADEVSAALRPNPMLTLANEDFRVFTPSAIDVARAQEFTYGVAETFERGGKRDRRIESARLATSVARHGYDDTLRQIELQVKTSFVALLLGKSNLEFAEANLRDYTETLRVSEVRMKAGDISPTEMDRIRLQQAAAEGDVLSARSAVAQARAQLQALLGVEAPRPDFDVTGRLEAFEVPVSFDDLLREALARRPDYLAALSGVEKAQADVRLASANGATDLTLGGEYKRNGPDNTLGFTVSLPLRFFDRNQGEKARARASLDASRATAAAARSQVAADVQQAFDAYRLALERARLYSPEFLHRARSVRDRAEFSYRQRASTLLEYQDALRAYRDIELASRAAAADALDALHQLSFVTGLEWLQ